MPATLTESRTTPGLAAARRNFASRRLVCPERPGETFSRDEAVDLSCRPFKVIADAMSNRRTGRGDGVVGGLTWEWEDGKRPPPDRRRVRVQGWRSSAVAPLSADAATLAGRYLPLVEKIVGRLSPRLPRSVDRDDLSQAGFLGLADACRQYDENRGVEFATFASRRIYGAIIDSLRRDDHAPRFARRSGKGIRTLSSLDAPLVAGPGQDDQPTLGDGLASPTTFTRVDRASFEELIAPLCSRTRLIFRLYYLVDLSMVEIGRACGLSESRVSQMHTLGISILRGSGRLRDLAA